NDLGVYPSRSEAIRVALGQFLNDEIKMFENLEDKTFKMLVRSNQKGLLVDLMCNTNENEALYNSALLISLISFK
ncbi:unnamed protein product, partial [marine sediment metagenome]